MELASVGLHSKFDSVGRSSGNPSLHDYPTDYRTSSFSAGSSGKSKRRGNPRKMPHMSKRRPKSLKILPHADFVQKKKGVTVGQIEKRKAEGEIVGKIHVAQRPKTLPVPFEGLPTSQ